MDPNVLGCNFIPVFQYLSIGRPLTFINIKVAIHSKDADLILEIIQEVPNSQILSYTGTGQVSAFGLTDAITFRAIDITG
jgi:hypothetical protein